MLKKNIFKIVILLLFSSPAFAYLDPGTGSMLLYFIMGVIATFTYFLKDIFYKVKGVVTGKEIDKGLRDLSGTDILFYSEGAVYWNVFLPIIEALEIEGVKSVYYTSGKDDPALKTNFKYMSAAYIGEDLSAFTLLNNIKVKVMIMTTPQLDIMQLKRSKNVEHYVHIVHSPTDVLLYKKFAFDYFDSVMCSGEHQIENIRELEFKRNLPKKILYKTGLTYYDVMYKNKPKPFIVGKNKTILVAPTWGANGMLTKFGITPLEKLMQADYQVILRPHPQMYVSQKELMNELETKLISYQNLTIDRESSGEASMAKADIMISDVSGIIFDFLFIYNKPVVVIEGMINRGGFEAEDVEKEIWECETVKQVATLVNFENIETLPNVVAEALNSYESKNVEQFKADSLFNFSQAGSVAADQIIDLIKD